MSRNFMVFLKYFVGFVVSLCFFVFLGDIKKQRDGEGWTTEVSASHGGAYTALHSGGDDYAILRIYDTRTRHILAERTFGSVDHHLNLRWTKDHVTYTVAGARGYEDDSVQLPPTYLDWLRTRLP